MILLRILIILGCILLFSFVVAALVFAGVVVMLLPTARKAAYLQEHGYQYNNGYWCKDDRSLAGEWIEKMTYSRLVDYVEEAEEKDSKEEAL